MLWPKIKASEAKQALETLIELGLLERDPHGRLRQATQVVSRDGRDQLVPAPNRDISALTFCVGPDGLARLKKRIQEMRRELIERG